MLSTATFLLMFYWKLFGQNFPTNSNVDLQHTLVSAHFLQLTVQFFQSSIEENEVFCCLRCRFRCFPYLRECLNHSAETIGRLVISINK